MNKETKKMLSLNATKIRIGIIEGTHSAKAGHPGGSLSSADLFSYLYFAEMKNLDPKKLRLKTVTDLFFQKVIALRAFTVRLHLRDIFRLKI